jgi:hypothetical protein
MAHYLNKENILRKQVFINDTDLFILKQIGANNGLYKPHEIINYILKKEEVLKEIKPIEEIKLNWQGWEEL